MNMSDTPMTDRAAFPALYMDRSEIGTEVVSVNCARPIERKLNAANAQIQTLREALEDLVTRASDCISFNQEDQIPECSSCDMELDNHGDGHSSSCSAKSIIDYANLLTTKPQA
jgi:hypothetical protein